MNQAEAKKLTKAIDKSNIIVCVDRAGKSQDYSHSIVFKLDGNLQLVSHIDKHFDGHVTNEVSVEIVVGGHSVWLNLNESVEILTGALQVLKQSIDFTVDPSPVNKRPFANECLHETWEVTTTPEYVTTAKCTCCGYKQTNSILDD